MFRKWIREVANLLYGSSVEHARPERRAPAEARAGAPPGVASGVAPAVKARDAAGKAAYAALALMLLAAACSPERSTGTDTSEVRATGALLVTVSGTPSGVTPAVWLDREGVRIPITPGSLNDSIPVGVYQLSAESFTSAGIRFDPNPASVSLTIVERSRISIDIPFTKQAGTIAVMVGGLPDGAAARITLTPPSGASVGVTRSTVITDAPTGEWRLTADDVDANDFTWHPDPSSASLLLTTNGSQGFQVVYEPTTSALMVAVEGAPERARVTVEGPDGYLHEDSGSVLLTGLRPGAYTVTAAEISNEAAVWRASREVQELALSTGMVDTAAVRYVVATGSVAVSVGGLPTNVAAGILMTGPSGYSAVINATGTITRLVPGSYELQASPITAPDSIYIPTRARLTREVIASLTASPAAFTYVAVARTGKLGLLVEGLPEGVAADVTVTGPGGFNRHLSGTAELSGLAPGAYTVLANSVASPGMRYEPSPPSQSVNVQPEGMSTVGVTYSGVPQTLHDDLSIAFAYVTQAVQRRNGTVPLVAGKPALLRVFGVNRRAASLTPQVEVQIFTGVTPVRSVVLPAPEHTMRTAPQESELSSSWNLELTEDEVVPGLRILVKIDPLNAIEESDETNNVWPLDGTPRSIPVHRVPPLDVTLIPVINNGLEGNVSEANKETYTVALSRMFPLDAINVTVGPAFTSSYGALTSDGTNWSAVLGEIYNLRTAQGSTATYYGVVHVNYNSGVAGIGYVGAPAAIGWDHSGNGINALVTAHELGHTFGRWHSPCAVTSGLQAGYPYEGGVIGQWGYNVATGRLYPPNSGDIMGYCFSNPWISDFTWESIMLFRGVSSANTVANVRPAVGANMTAGVNARATKLRAFPYLDTRTDSLAGGLMVSANVTRGRIQPAPAFRVPAYGQEPPLRVTHIVEALDMNGKVLAAVSAQAMEVDHERDVSHLAVVLPWSEELEVSLFSIRIRDVLNPASTAITRTRASRERRGGRVVMLMPEPERLTIEAVNAERVRIDLGTGYRDALVRDAATGSVLGFVRNGKGEIAARPGQSLDIVYSDGVRSISRRYR